MQPPWLHRASTRRPVAAAAWRGRDAPYGGRGRLPPRPDQPSLTDLQADAAAWEAAAAAEAETRAADAAASVAELAARRRAAREAAPPTERPPAGSAYGRWRRDEPAQRQRPPPDPFFGDLDAGGRAVRDANQRRRRPRQRSPPPDTLSPEDAELERLRSAVQAGVARAAAADAAATSAAGRRAASAARRDRGRGAAPPPPTPDGARSTLFDPRARLAAKVAGVLTLAESIRDGREEEGGWWEEGGPPPRRPRRPRRRQVEDDW